MPQAQGGRNAMRSAAGTPLGRLAIVLGAVAVALAVTVPIGLSSGSARGPVTNYVTYTGGKVGKANARLSPVVIGAINTQGGQVLVGPGGTNGIRRQSSTSTATSAASRATRSSSATASPPPPRR